MPRQQLKPRSLALSIFFLTGTSLWAGCSKPAPTPSSESSATAGPYAGSAACAECHQEIHQTQSVSNHARSLRPGTADELPTGNKPSPLIADNASGLSYQVLVDQDPPKQRVSRKDEVIETAELSYLLGSGHHGMSPVNFDGKDWRYLALTYYANHGWDFSPVHGIGREAVEGKGASGWPVSLPEIEKCFSCHATRLGFEGNRLDPKQTELGIRCESCHGPGRDDLAAARAGAKDLAIQQPRSWSNESFMALCQQCHNETATLEGTLFGISKDPASPKTVKYHVYGTQQSECYKKSGDAFRCTTCHDPHANSETDASYYQAKCLSCHTAPEAKQQVCPVEPKGDCLPCHMPKVKVEKYTYFADHWIRARSPFAKKRAAKAPSL